MADEVSNIQTVFPSLTICDWLNLQPAVSVLAERGRLQVKTWDGSAKVDTISFEVWVDQ